MQILYGNFEVIGTCNKKCYVKGLGFQGLNVAWDQYEIHCLTCCG